MEAESQTIIFTRRCDSPLKNKVCEKQTCVGARGINLRFTHVVNFVRDCNVNSFYKIAGYGSAEDKESSFIARLGCGNLYTGRQQKRGDDERDPTQTHSNHDHNCCTAAARGVS